MIDEKITKWKTIEKTANYSFEVDIDNIIHHVALFKAEDNTYSVYGNYIEPIYNVTFSGAIRYYKNTVSELKMKALLEAVKELDLEDQEREGKKSLQDAIKECSDNPKYSIVVGKLPKSLGKNLDCVVDCFFDRDIDNWVTIINTYELNER